MFLKSVRLKGFKSFARQIELSFEPGVGVIIGPNGSGKSNLADAVVWALGEQSPTTMRGSSMQDVIFAGSDGRRAGGSAEVELTMDNADGAVPLPTPEVSIMRRVTRDGSSQYFINHSACRLSDVVELMAGVGLGKELHSIIGQGKVESFLAGKPEDRRDQIEEAAGLGTFKRRRERAELKLREVRRNLERADLLEREVGSQLSPLRRQANAAGQLRTVETAIAETRGRLLAGEVAALDRDGAAQRGELAAVEEQRATLEAELAEFARLRADEEEAFARRLAERERRARRLLRARVLEGRLDSSLRLVEQRTRLVEEVRRASAEERERLVASLAGEPEEPEAGGFAAEEERLGAELRAAEEAQAGSAARLAEDRAGHAAARAAHDAAALGRETALAALARLERRDAALEGEAGRLAVQVAALEGELGGKADAEQAAAAVSEAAARELRAAERAAGGAREAQVHAERAAQDAGERYGALLAERRALAAEAEHLRATLRDLEDVGADVLEAARVHTDAVSLAGALTCEPGYERALAAALAQLSGALVVPAEVDRWSLLGALKDAGVGLVRLLVPARRRAVVAFPGSVALLDRVGLDGDEQIAAALADVVIVDDLRAVPDGFGGLAVTRDGEFYRPSSGQLGLAAGVPAALLLERRASLERLDERLAAARAQEVREEAAAALAQQAAENAREAQRLAGAAEREARIAHERLARELTEVRGRRRDMEEARARAARSLEGIAAERAEAATEAEGARQAAAAALVAVEAARPEVEAAAATVLAAEAAHEAALSEATRRRVELEERRAAARRAAERLAQARRRAAEDRARLQALERRLGELPAAHEVCGELARRVASLTSRATALIERLDGESPEAADLDRGALHALAAREAERRRDLDEAGERRMRAEIALARLDDRRTELTEALDEVSEQLDAAGFAPPTDDDEAGELRTQLERLGARRERIGPVNPLAESECAELEERAAFLREQRRDLEKSLAEVESLIRELTSQIDTVFAETFAAVQEQFAHMVALLFPGGRGSLRLVGQDEEAGAGGVAVEVKPAKKLGKKLQLLSGGERALVAIAFLMALVLARPCPFYILDEIEAALDDVNISRLVKLLRDYRERTQFIIITHQKRTMEAADVLYGVTMGPDGASQVVSARMAQEEIERELRTGTQQ